MPGAEWIQFNEGLDQTRQQRSPSQLLLTEIEAAKHLTLSSLHRRGAVLFSEGQQARGVYVLRAGRAKVSVSSSEGKVLLLRIAQPGEFLGVNSTLKNCPYDATIQTLEVCRTDFISASDFLSLLNRSKDAQIGVLDALSKELTEVFERVRYLLLPKSTVEKLARLLLKWCDELGQVGPKGIHLSPGLTHEEIAQMICASRETVTRLFAELKRKRIVSLAENSIIVRNRKALEILACV